MKRLFRSRKGIGTVVGTVMFIAILLFFLTNVVLWGERIETLMAQREAEKKNSEIILEAISRGEGVPILSSGFDPIEGEPVEGDHTRTHVLDGECHITVEEKAHGQVAISLKVDYSFQTGITTLEERIVTTEITINITAEYFEDDEYESCSIYIYNNVVQAYQDTNFDLGSGVRHIVFTMTPAYAFISSDGLVKLRYDSDIEVKSPPEKEEGELKIDYHSVTVKQFALRVTNLGGQSAHLMRLWIIELETNNHTQKDFEDLDVWVSGGSQRIIVLGTELRVRADGAIEVDWMPTAPGNVYFKVVTERGNTAADDFDFV